MNSYVLFIFNFVFSFLILISKFLALFACDRDPEGNVCDFFSQNPISSDFLLNPNSNPHILHLPVVMLDSGSNYDSGLDEGFESDGWSVEANVGSDKDFDLDEQLGADNAFGYLFKCYYCAKLFHESPALRIHERYCQRLVG